MNNASNFNNNFGGQNQNRASQSVARPASQQQQIFRNSTNSATDGEHNPIVCECNAEAILLTVRKDGLNKDRQFYKCASNVCNFFLWFDSNGNNINSGNSSFSNTSANYSNLPRGNANHNARGVGSSSSKFYFII